MKTLFIIIGVIVIGVVGIAVYSVFFGPSKEERAIAKIEALPPFLSNDTYEVTAFDQGEKEVRWMSKSSNLAISIKIQKDNKFSLHKAGEGADADLTYGYKLQNPSRGYAVTQDSVWTTEGGRLVNKIHDFAGPTKNYYVINVQQVSENSAFISVNEGGIRLYEFDLAGERVKKIYEESFSYFQIFSQRSGEEQTILLNIQSSFINFDFAGTKGVHEKNSLFNHSLNSLSLIATFTPKAGDITAVGIDSEKAYVVKTEQGRDLEKYKIGSGNENLWRITSKEK